MFIVCLIDFRRLVLICTCTMIFMAAAVSRAATVQFQTFLGDFEAELFDQRTPIASAVFLSLVSDEVYQNSIIHRIENNTILQGGGFALEGNTLNAIVYDNTLRSEVLFSNVRGTLAFADPAEIGSGARSVQWFINVADNSEILDNQNGGYTVFGRVSDSGMAVVDAIAKLPKLNFDAFPDLPLRQYSEQDAINGIPITRDNYATVDNIVVLDAGSIDSFNLPPLVNEPAPAQTPAPTGENEEPIEGIGGIDRLTIFGLLLIALFGKLIRFRNGEIVNRYIITPCRKQRRQ